MVLIKRKAREFLFTSYVSINQRLPVDLLRCDSAQRSFFRLPYLWSLDRLAGSYKPPYRLDGEIGRHVKICGRDTYHASSYVLITSSR